MIKFIAFILVSIAAARADLEFTGFFATSKESVYMLTDKKSNHTSGWLKVGDSFEGYTIEAFEKDNDVLVLRRGPNVLRLPIRQSKVKDSGITIVGTIELGPNSTIDVIRATLFVDEETMFPVNSGVSLFLKPERRSDGNLSYRARFEVVQSDGTRDRVEFPEIGARPGQPFRIQSGDFGFGFIPEKPNKAPEPTPGAVTPRATEGASK